MMRKMIHLMIVNIIIGSLLYAGKVIYSSDKDAINNVARVEKYISFPSKSGIKIAIISVDTGGSTDVSATQTVYFTLYKRGEMFSTDASFSLGYCFSLKSAIKKSDGVYSILVMGAGKNAMILRRYEINAKKALDLISKVDCGGDMDCDASTYFQSTISLHKESTSNASSSNDESNIFNSIETYYARISNRDKHGIGNRRLKDVAAILQQDRANYHKYHKRYI